ncbi:hypothetical protein SUGI_0973800 [Cryptomeria japonica]|nr:hypothetical protein SUGI_0973800 [Cryptomeria japonica]
MSNHTKENLKDIYRKIKLNNICNQTTRKHRWPENLCFRLLSYLFLFFLLVIEKIIFFKLLASIPLK